MFMKSTCFSTTFIALSVLLGIAAAEGADTEQAEDESGLEVVVVTGVKSREPLMLQSSEVTQPGLDNSDVLRLFPGGNRNANGPLTRISQYRGLFGAQNNVFIDGLAYTAGGPNWMDSPLSSIPQSLTDSVTLYRGLGSVDVIEEGLGGGVGIESRQGEFTAEAAWSGYGHAEASYGSNASSRGAAVYAGVRNNRNWLDIGASLDRGDDYEFDGGTVAATEYDRSQFRAGYGHHFDQVDIRLGAVVNRTGDSGTPALPMDIRFVDSEQYKLDLDARLGSGALSFRVNTLSVDHLMDNFTLRPVPVNAMGMAMYRQTVALGDADAAKLTYEMDLGGASLAFGVDGRRENHDADISNPKNDRFYITNFNDVERDRFGVFVMATGTAGSWDLEAGLRHNRVEMDAGEVGGNLGMMPSMMSGMLLAQQERLDELAEAFNNADRNQQDGQWSGILKASWNMNDRSRLNFGLGRKVRSPGYQERYLWLPMEATAGLADGRTYIGDIELLPEKSIELTAGIDWSSSGFKLTPELFYREIDDYIQGVPSSDMTANMFAMMMTGKKPLQFANVDAEIYGLDLAYEWEINDAWLLRGILSYVRGKRRDVEDNLYRIAPLSSFLELMYLQDRYFVSAESVAAARQDRVAAFNDEKETPGWGIVNVRGGIGLGEQFRLLLGIENLFDKVYQDHLGGYNRVIGSDVPVGERLYSKGRNIYVKLNAKW